MGGIRGQEQDATTPRGVAERERRRRGAGRLADSALAGDDKEPDAGRREQRRPGDCDPGSPRRAAAPSRMPTGLLGTRR